MTRSLRLSVLGLIALPACMPTLPEPVTRALGPPDARPGACYARGFTPAVLETVTEQVVEAEAIRAGDGRILQPAQFRTITTTRIVQERETTWFETPCALRRQDPDFVMQIQRALQVRGLYEGPIHGFYDVPTRAAVQRFQDASGVESGTLSIESAKALGLVALGRGG